MKISRTDTLLVVAWHNAGPSWAFPAPAGAALTGLARQIRALRRWGNVVALAPALDDLVAGRPLPPRAVALTFDDGYRDNLELVLPLLEHEGAPATFYLVPGLLDGTVDPWWETLAWAVTCGRAEATWNEHRVRPGGVADPAVATLTEALKRVDGATRSAAVADIVRQLDPPGRSGIDDLFMTWDDARRLRGRVEIGSHTLTHPILACETPDAQDAELAGARHRLEHELETEIPTLAYPNGTPADYDDATLAAARRAGHRFAVTTRPGWNRPDTAPLELRRVVMNPARGWDGLRPILGGRRGALRAITGRA